MPRQVEHACYSVPYRYVSHRLDVRLSTVEIYADFDLIPTWDLRNATYNSPFAKFSDDDDWATWYSDWLLNLSSLHELLGARPSPERALLAGLDNEYTSTHPTEPWEDYYARQLLERLPPRPDVPCPSHNPRLTIRSQPADQGDTCQTLLTAKSL